MFTIIIITLCLPLWNMRYLFLKILNELIIRLWFWNYEKLLNLAYEDSLLRVFPVAFTCRMGLTLHQHGHSHSGSQNHIENQVENSSPRHNINVRAAFIHVLGDFIQSFGVFVAALVIFFEVWSSYSFILWLLQSQPG